MLDLTDEFDRRVRRLRNYVVRAQKSGQGAILFAVWRHAAIRKLAASALQEMLEAERFNVRTIDAGEAPEGGFIDHLVDASHGPNDVLFIFGLGRAGEDGLTALNYQREVFVEHPLLAVFWVREPELNAIAATAPDFWAFRNRVVEFPEAPDQPRLENLAQHVHGNTTYGSVEELRAKLALRNSLLQELPEVAYSTRVRLLIEAGDMYHFLGQIDEAVERHNQALTIARAVGDRRNEGDALGNLGSDYAALGEVDEAIEHHKQAIIIAREVGDKRNESKALGNLGNVHVDLGKMDTAIEHYERALTISRELGDRRGEGADLGNLGVAYAGLGEVKKAVNYHRHALTMAREAGERRNESIHLGNLGNAYAYLGEVDRAIEFHQQALAIAREIGDRQGEGLQLGNLGDDYADLGEVDRAINHNRQARVIAREIGDRRGEGYRLWSLGSQYLAIDHYKSALRHFLQAWSIFQAVKDPATHMVIRDFADLRMRVGEAKFSAMWEKAAEESGIELSHNEPNPNDM